MSKREQLLQAILNQESGVQVYPARVLRVDGNQCTVELLSSGLEIDEVRLQADIDASDRFILRPKVGSTVLVGCVENEVATLYVAQYTEIDSFDLIIGEVGVGGDKNGLILTAQNAQVSLDNNRLSITHRQSQIDLAGGRIKVSNGAVSLKTLFTDLTTLLNALVVVTPSGPSTALGPTSIAAVQQLTAKVNQLLD